MHIFVRLTRRFDFGSGFLVRPNIIVLTLPIWLAATCVK